MTDYEQCYREQRYACGEQPFAEVAAFFDALPRAPQASILDVGCGQGRDALYAAGLGHVVHGLDLSATGVAQTLDRASARALSVTAEVADVTTYGFESDFDVVLCDRVLHCLPSEKTRRAVLGRMGACVVPGGYLFVVEPRSGEALLADYLRETRRWHRHPLRPGFVLAQAVA